MVSYLPKSVPADHGSKTVVQTFFKASGLVLKRVKQLGAEIGVECSTLCLEIGYEQFFFAVDITNY